MTEASNTRGRILSEKGQGSFSWGSKHWETPMSVPLPLERKDLGSSAPLWSKPEPQAREGRKVPPIVT